jgi:hypothetical protein
VADVTFVLVLGRLAPRPGAMLATLLLAVVLR